MKITATAPNLTGRPSKTTATVKLRGQAKPKPKHRHQPSGRPIHT
jgi:hypothetical protein